MPLIKPLEPSQPSGTARTVEELLEALCELPGSPNAALQVMRLCDDPNTDTGKVADAVQADPILTARLLRMANSAYFGLSRRVATARNAIVVVGFSTVRSVAALAAGGLTRSSVPEHFWSHSAWVAVAASHLASHTGARAPEAFSAGLLHDLGEALFHQVDPAAAQRTRSSDDRLAAEIDEFGLSHSEAGRMVLEAWQFPSEFASAVARHHDELTQTPLVACLRLAEALVEGDSATLEAGGVSAEEAAAARAQVEEEAQVLSAGLR